MQTPHTAFFRHIFGPAEQYIYNSSSMFVPRPIVPLSSWQVNRPIPSPAEQNITIAFSVLSRVPTSHRPIKQLAMSEDRV